MTMVIELARFTIHDGAEERLLAERPAMIDALRRRFPACLAAYLSSVQRPRSARRSRACTRCLPSLRCSARSLRSRRLRCSLSPDTGGPLEEDDGGWLDVLLWRGRAEAEEAARLVDSVPECREWFRHIAKSGGLRHVRVMNSWVGGQLPT
jgi:hypothetical protein